MNLYTLEKYVHEFERKLADKLPAFSVPWRVCNDFLYVLQTTFTPDKLNATNANIVNQFAPCKSNNNADVT